jgi:hypothetical protein
MDVDCVLMTVAFDVYLMEMSNVNVEVPNALLERSTCLVVDIAAHVLFAHPEENVPAAVPAVFVARIS